MSTIITFFTQSGHVDTGTFSDRSQMPITTELPPDLNPETLLTLDRGADDIVVENRRSELRMWLAVRTDLTMSQGKIATQAGHAYGGLYRHLFLEKSSIFDEYLRGAAPKITVRSDDLPHLLRVVSECVDAGIPHYLVIDAGRTELDADTSTCCAFGPCRRDDLPSFLRRLRLF